MYKFPIEIIRKEAEIKIGNDVFKPIQEYGIKVDKDELIKALKYDRGQYEKGYKDGYKSGVIQFVERLSERADIDFGGVIAQLLNEMVGD